MFIFYKMVYKLINLRIRILRRFTMYKFISKQRIKGDSGHDSVHT